MPRHVSRSWLLIILACGLARADVYVSPSGSDSNAGTQAAPSSTLERARTAVRQALMAKAAQAGPVTVWLAEGRYQVEQTFSLGREDSGTQAAPVVYRAMPGQEVRLSGARRVPSRAFSPVSDEAVLMRLDPAARGKVYQADLRALGISNFGEVPPNGKRAGLYFNDKPLTLARWPNEGFAKIADVVGGEPLTIPGVKGDRIGKFTVEGGRPFRWRDERTRGCMGIGSGTGPTITRRSRHRLKPALREKHPLKRALRKRDRLKPGLRTEPRVPSPWRSRCIIMATAQASGSTP
jgi:hypothetical protein